ncbi:MAG: arginase family protein [Limnohabitans sp.]|nr:arginase family protein [Limnohabitans sp.]
MNLKQIKDFLDPIHLAEISEDLGYNKNQIGHQIVMNLDGSLELDHFDLAIVGVEEYRGMGLSKTKLSSANTIRKELYQLYHWKENIILADLGNIKIGGKVNDTYAALKSVLSTLMQLNKKVIIIGGSQDLTIPQYQAYQYSNKLIDCICIDSKIDFDVEGSIPVNNYLEYLFTNLPNHLRNFTLMAYQNYYGHVEVLNTIDNLMFDCIRLGFLRQDVTHHEPVFRNSHMVSFDVNAIQYAAAPTSIHSPNGLDGVEACTLSQFAGMSSLCSTFGIYNYIASEDIHNLTAKQISQILWYYIIGHGRSLNEKPLKDKKNFEIYHVELPDNEHKFLFLKSKSTQRWWMELIDNKFIACSLRDFVYLKDNHEIPKRWEREIDRL